MRQVKEKNKRWTVRGTPWCWWAVRKKLVTSILVADLWLRWEEKGKKIFACFYCNIAKCDNSSRLLIVYKFKMACLFILFKALIITSPPFSFCYMRIKRNNNKAKIQGKIFPTIEGEIQQIKVTTGKATRKPVEAAHFVRLWARELALMWMLEIDQLLKELSIPRENA